MLDPLDPLLFFACFDDDEETSCPYCKDDLVVTSESGKMGREQFQCHDCGGVFVIDWGEQKIYFDE